MKSRKAIGAAKAKPETAPSPTLAYLCAGILILAGVLAYSDSFRGVFVYDDLPSIEQNQSLRQMATWFHPPTNSTAGGRPLLNASFGLNYAWGELSIFGYHLVNLLIHLGNSLLVFGIIRRTNPRPDAKAHTLVAATAAGLWLLHPLQTESVTYLVQRAESLAGFFYLAGLYCFIRSLTPTPRSAAWRLGALLSIYCGVGTKEILVTAPVAFLFYDRTFAAKSFADCWRLRKGFYLALTLSWVPLGALILLSHGRAGTVGFSHGLGWPAYAASQAGAIVRYLWLSLWPFGLTFDYGFRPLPISSLLVAEGVALASLLGLTAWAFLFRPVMGFLMAAFFLLLAPTSSFVPITTEIMAEHRMYLPLIPVLVGAVLLLRRLPRTVFIGAVATLATVYLCGTLARNVTYHEALTVWADTVYKCPDNERARMNLGIELQKIPGRESAALREFQEAVRLNPDYPEARNDLGMALERLPGQRREAIEQYRRAITIKPTYTDARYNLANALADLGEPESAVAQYRIALSQLPDSSAILCNLGATLGQMGRSEEAVGVLKHALEVNPNDPTALYDLAYEYALKPGGKEAALPYLNHLLDLDPQNPAALKLQRELNTR